MKLVTKAKTALAGYRRRLRREIGTSMVEVVVAMAIMGAVAGSMSTLVGAAVRNKYITISRSIDTVTARQTLEWMSERMRNAGLDILPAAQAQPRCRDMVVAQDAALRPQPDRVYVSGEIFNTNTTAGDEVITLGYRLSGGVVVQESSACGGPWSPATSTVSDSRVTVTNLTFRYFNRAGDEIAVPTTDVTAIQSIRMILVSLTVQSSQGRSGPQTQTFTRMIMLRNPQPNNNLWLAPSETTP